MGKLEGIIFSAKVIKTTLLCSNKYIKLLFQTFLARYACVQYFYFLFFIYNFFFQDVKNWEPKRLGALVLYIFVTILSCQSIYKAVRAPIIERERRELAEAYMDALIPEPTPTNVRK